MPICRSMGRSHNFFLQMPLEFSCRPGKASVTARPRPSVPQCSVLMLPGFREMPSLAPPKNATALKSLPHQSEGASSPTTSSQTLQLDGTHPDIAEGRTPLEPWTLRTSVESVESNPALQFLPPPWCFLDFVSNLECFIFLKYFY